MRELERETEVVEIAHEDRPGDAEPEVTFDDPRAQLANELESMLPPEEREHLVSIRAGELSGTDWFTIFWHGDPSASLLAFQRDAPAPVRIELVPYTLSQIMTQVSDMVAVYNEEELGFRFSTVGAAPDYRSVRLEVAPEDLELVRQCLASGPWHDVLRYSDPAVPVTLALQAFRSYQSR